MKARLLCAALAAFLLLGSVGIAETPSGQIYLYGEWHAQEAHLNLELEIWREFYAEGMRHLFIEMPYYTAEYLNEWMRMDNDSFLMLVYADWHGTMSHDPAVLDFYRKLKAECPETIFHGTDVGHQYNTTGKKYLLHLEATDRKDTDQYALTLQAIEQGKHTYQNGNTGNIYRENRMVENFIRAFDSLGGEDVMGIYGTAHVALGEEDYTQSVPNLASQLVRRYGDAVHLEDLSLLLKDIAPLRTDTIEVGGVSYEALYFGQQDLTGFKNFATRDFWRLEGAYDAMKGLPATGDMLPYDNYPMSIEQGQVFLIEYSMTDGSTARLYYRADGNDYQGRPTTEGFVAEQVYPLQSGEK